MKRIFFPALAIIVLFNCCSKAFQDSAANSLTYYFHAPGDQYITANGTLHYFPFLTVTTGSLAQTPVTISFRNLPSGISVAPTSITLGLDSNLVFIFSASQGVAIDSYTVQMNIAASGSDLQTHNFTLHTLPAQNLGQILGVGPYTYHHLSSSYCFVGQVYNMNYDTIAGNPSAFSLVNFFNWGQDDLLTIEVDLGSSASNSQGKTNVFIPRQTLNGKVITGTGYYVPSGGKIGYFYLHDTMASAGTKTQCNDVYY